MQMKANSMPLFIDVRRDQICANVSASWPRPNFSVYF